VSSTTATLDNVMVIKATPNGSAVRAIAFTREFALSAASAEKSYKNKAVIVEGKVEKIAQYAVVLSGYVDKKKTSFLVVAKYTPDWEPMFAEVKVGDEIGVSGNFDAHDDHSVVLTGCWLMK
jgi:hypothetical protein